MELVQELKCTTKVNTESKKNYKEISNDKFNKTLEKEFPYNWN